ncbi:MAG TPA: ATP-grasp domain-containing protein, partial [Candidatus Saccharimonadales bacterium]|nr:ATP-grasp domain-containing protein [Candidatus Saccharimonadales bacterium]
RYILLQDRDDAREDTRATEIIKADLRDPISLEEVARKYGGQIDGVVSIFEEFVEPAAILTGHLNLPGSSVEAARAATDKQLMRQKFADAPEKISPEWAEVKSLDDLLAFASSHGFPLIMKPANLVKSLLVSKSNSLEELKKNYENTTRTIDDVYKRYARGRQPKIIVEEFLDGTQHSVAAFATNSGEVVVADGIADIVTASEKGFEDSFLYSRGLPSRLPADVQKNVRHVAELGVKSLGLRSCPAHVEIMLTKDGPMIIEIGARIGGYRQRMYQLASGIDLSSAVLDLALGKQIELNVRKNEACEAIELFPEKPGRLREIVNLDRLKALPSLAYLSVKHDAGELVGKASGGFKATAVVILHSADRSQLQVDAHFIENEVSVEVD